MDKVDKEVTKAGKVREGSRSTGKATSGGRHGTGSSHNVGSGSGKVGVCSKPRLATPSRPSPRTSTTEGGVRMGVKRKDRKDPQGTLDKWLLNVKDDTVGPRMETTKKVESDKDLEPRMGMDDRGRDRNGEHVLDISLDIEPRKGPEFRDGNIK